MQTQMISGSRISRADLIFDYGVIHVIDSVMRPPIGSAWKVIQEIMDFRQFFDSLRKVAETDRQNQKYTKRQTIEETLRSMFQSINQSINQSIIQIINPSTSQLVRWLALWN